MKETRKIWFVSSEIAKLTAITLMLCILSQRSYATETMDCYWHCGYFDVVFIGNYGGDDRGERYTEDVVKRANIIIGLDNILGTQKFEGELENFTRWVLIDDYMKCYDYRDGRKEPKQIRIDGRNVFLCLTDSNSISSAVGKLWNIPDTLISPNRQFGMWLFSLHVGLSKTRLSARPFPHGGDVNARPDSNLLWLKCDGCVVPHFWYQHEKDGYYHQYTGLYLTSGKVLKAQKLLQENCNLNTSVTSHFVTPAIIRKYAGWNF